MSILGNCLLVRKRAVSTDIRKIKILLSLIGTLTAFLFHPDAKGRLLLDTGQGQKWKLRNNCACECVTGYNNKSTNFLPELQGVFKGECFIYGNPLEAANANTNFT